MKKQFGTIIILLFALLHFVNAIGLISHSILFACVWFLFSIIEISICIFVIHLEKKGNEWGKRISIFTSSWLVIQAVLSLFVLLNSFSFNTNHADKLFVLGYQLKDNQMSSTLLSRVEYAYNYALKNPECSVIVSGGVTGNNTVSEASLMKDALISFGLDENRIIVEEDSTDTIENIKYCKELVDEGDHVVIVSSNYHCARIKLIASKQGLEVNTLGADCPLNLMMNQLMIEKIAMIGVLFS